MVSSMMLLCTGISMKPGPPEKLPVMEEPPLRKGPSERKYCAMAAFCCGELAARIHISMKNAIMAVTKSA